MIALQQGMRDLYLYFEQHWHRVGVHALGHLVKRSICILYQQYMIMRVVQGIFVVYEIDQFHIDTLEPPALIHLERLNTFLHILSPHLRCTCLDK